MKKIFALLLAVMMAIFLAACGNNADNPSGSGNNDPGVTQNVEQNADPNAPVSSVNNAAGRGSYAKHNAEEAQELLVSMGLPEYPSGIILYAKEFEEGDGTVYIKGTTLDECVSYCRSLTGVSPAYADSNSNGKYVNYTCEGNGFTFTIKFFAEEQVNSYKMNGSPVTEVWQMEIDFAPTGGSNGGQTGGPVIVDGWEIPEFPYGELVHTEYDENSAVVALYYNNVTIEDCHTYCLTIESLGYYEIFKIGIHEDDDGLGRWINYIGMHPSSYNNYQVDYPSENMEHTVETADGEVEYQVVIRNRGK